MAARVIAILLLAIVAIAALPLAANLYAEAMYSGLRSGMTRVNVNRHLWAFASRPNTTYQGIGPGYFVVRYELLWFGKAASIQVVSRADGTVCDPQPIFRD